MSSQTSERRDGVRALVGRPRSRRDALRDPLTVVFAVGAIVALGGTMIGSLLSPGRDPLPVITGTATGPTTIAEGPGGRVALRLWVLRRDAANVGLKDGWWRGAFAGGNVLIPHVANPDPVSGAGASRNFQGSIAWYRTSFTAPRKGLYGVDFGSVNQLATVWLDGHALGSHLGEYLPFEYRVPLSKGPHTLVVRADWRNPAGQTSEGLHRTWFNFGGIDREVSVRPIGDADIVASTIGTRLSNGRAIVTVTMQVDNYGSRRTVPAAGTLSRAGQSISLSFAGQPVRSGGTTRLRAQVTIDHPALWSPAAPNLYALQLTAGDSGSYTAAVGLRQLTWPGGRLYLNGRRLVLHGASIQEDAPGVGDALTPVDQQALVDGLRKIGANATRSQHPLDPGLLERLDAAGILVWQGVGPVDPAGDWTASTPALLGAVERRVRISVAQAQLHPSIVAWNLVNEIAGNGHAGGQDRYVERTAAWLHRADPGRMVAVDIWGEHPPHVAGPLYANVDAIGETNYAGWYDDAPSSPASIESFIRRRLANLERVFPGKVVIISEFGAESNAQNADPRLGSYAYQQQLLSEHIRVYDADRLLSGMLVWDLRDFAVDPAFAGGSINVVDPGIHLVKGINQKGLFDYFGRPKPAAAAVRRAFVALGAY